MQQRTRVSRPGAAVALDVTIGLVLTIWSVTETLVADAGPGFVVAAAGMTAPLLVRRTCPLAMAGLIASVMTLQALVAEPPEQIWLLITVIIASYSVGAFERSIRLSMLAVLALAVAVAVGIAQDTSDSLDNIPPTVLIFVVAPWSAGRALRHRDREARKLTAQVDALEHDREVLAREAVFAERARIARELHDVVAHSLSVIAIQADAAEGALAKDPDRAREPLAAVKHTAREALTEMRHLLGLLRDEGGAGLSLEPQPGLESLGALVEQVRAAGLSVDLTVTGDAQPLPAGADLSAFRLVQEALTNTLKHAGANRASVSVRHTDQRVELVVVDDGSVDAARQSNGDGHGLIGMQERVALYGGTLEVGPVLGGGYRVLASLPR
jgi:signal transduction histidine kinase